MFRVRWHRSSIGFRSLFYAVLFTAILYASRVIEIWESLNSCIAFPVFQANELAFIAPKRDFAKERQSGCSSGRVHSKTTNIGPAIRASCSLRVRVSTRIRRKIFRPGCRWKFNAPRTGRNDFQSGDKSNRIGAWKRGNEEEGRLVTRGSLPAESNVKSTSAWLKSS